MNQIVSNLQIDRLQLAPYFPIGTILHYAGQTAPQGWLVADGSLLLKANFPDLFSVLGVVFGGDGITTFGLPNLLGEFIRGYDKGRGVDTGRAFGSEQLDQLQGHAHTIFIRQQNTNALFDHADAGYNGSVGSDTTTGIASDGTNGTPRTGAETRPRNVALLPIIKAVNNIGFDPTTQGANAALLNGLTSASFALIGGQTSQVFQAAYGVNPNEAVVMGQFAGSPSGGWQKLPSGLIIQYGSALNNGSPRTITFPIAFPNGCNSVVVTMYGGGSSLNLTFGLTDVGWNKTGFTGYMYANNAVSTLAYNGLYIAIGY